MNGLLNIFVRAGIFTAAGNTLSLAAHALIAILFFAHFVAVMFFIFGFI